MRIILFCMVLIAVSSLTLGQGETKSWSNLSKAAEEVNFNKTTFSDSTKSSRIGGFMAYYFWETRESGQIIDSTLSKPFKSNFELLIPPTSKKNHYSINQIQEAVFEMKEYNGQKMMKKRFKIHPPKKRKEKIKVNIMRSKTSEYGSIIYVKTKNSITSQKAKNVLYFEMNHDGSMYFKSSSDSLILPFHHLQKLANIQYYVVTNLDASNQMIDQQVYAYNGENITSLLLKDNPMTAKRLLVFSNGYRGPNRNNDNSDNLVTTNDRFNYWLRLDKAFIKRLKPFEYFYIDGNFNINTSSHNNMLKAGFSLCAVKINRKKNSYRLLNSTPNVNGFNLRRAEGRIAGQAFLNTRCNSPACAETKDTLDIVCHSMGYSYALGFADVVATKVILGKCYIIAPESASIGGMDWALFNEVWQYGTNLDQPQADPVWQQDGIAPQLQVKGLEYLAAEKGGRVFFPSDWPIKNFVDSHMLYNYFWMFDNIRKGEKGYIH